MNINSNPYMYKPSIATGSVSKPLTTPATEPLVSSALTGGIKPSTGGPEPYPFNRPDTGSDAGNIREQLFQQAVLSFHTNPEFKAFVEKALTYLDPSSQLTVSVFNNPVSLAGKFPKLFQGLTNVANSSGNFAL